MKLKFIHADDWCGLYRDGKLIVEGHSLNTRDVCYALGLDLDVDDCTVKQVERLYDEGYLPKTLAELETWK